MDEQIAYQEALHFCTNNSTEVIARNMAMNMVRIEKLRKRVSFLSNLCIRSKVEEWTESQVMEAINI